MNETGPQRIPWDDYLAMHVREIGLAVLAVVAIALAWSFIELPGGTELTGTVTSAGKPVTYGTVTVVAADNRVYTAPIGPDGSYRIKALPPGPVRVAVSSPNPRSVFEQMPAAAGAGGGGAEQRPAGRSGPDEPTGGPGSPASAAGAAAGGGGGGNGRRSGGKGAGEPEPVAVAAPNGTAPPFPAPVVPTGRQQGQQQGWFRIPGRYASPATSGIRGDVKRGRTPLNLKLD